MKNFIFVLLLTLLTTVSLQAEGNKAVETLSQIKAIAQVTKIEVVKRAMEHTEAKVHFRRVKAIGGTKFGRLFTAKCFMTDSFFQRPNPKGPRLFKPKMKEQVYVTVLRDGGPLTSYTKITTELLNTLIKNPESVIIRDGKAVIEKAEKKEKPQRGRRRRGRRRR